VRDAGLCFVSDDLRKFGWTYFVCRTVKNNTKNICNTCKNRNNGRLCMMSSKGMMMMISKRCSRMLKVRVRIKVKA